MDHNGWNTGQYHHMNQERKLAEIQRQKEHVERQLLARSKQLQHYHEYLEKERKQAEERVLDGLHNERKYLLDEEAKRFYGTEHRILAAVPGVLETILSERKREFQKKTQEAVHQMKYLNEERQRLQQARQRIKENKTFSKGYSPLPSPAQSLNEEDRTFGDDETFPGGETDLGCVPHEMDLYIADRRKKLDRETHSFLTKRSIFNEVYRQKNKAYTGELGPESYAPWQLEDYDMVRKLVGEFVEEFLDKHLPPDYHLLEKDVAQARIAADREEIHQLHTVTVEEKAVNLIMEELLLEVTSSLIRKAVFDIYHLYGCLNNLTDLTIMTMAERVVTGQENGRAPDDPGYADVTKTFLQHQGERTQSKANKWVHCYSLSTEDPSRIETEDAGDEEAYANEGIPLIDFDSVPAVDISIPLVAKFSDVKGTQLAQNNYISKELAYWKEMDPYLFSILLARKCKGVTAVCPSVDHRYLALGTGHGDIIVYGLWTSPWLIVRMAVNLGKADDPVIDIHWELHSTRLVTVNALGGIQVWSMTPWGPPLDRSVIRGFGLSLPSNSYLPFQLLPLLSLHAEDEDFRFQMGPLATREAITTDYLPTLATYFPDVTMLGAQHSLCVALENGDILKLNTESITKTTSNQNPVQETSERTSDQSEERTFKSSPRFIQKPITTETPSFIGLGVPTELLRKHTSSLMLIGYIENCGKMVTVDEEGYVNLWKYSRSQMKGSDWLEPVQRYRLNLFKTMYTPAKDSERNVIFSEKNMTSKKISRENVDKRRKQVEETLKARNLGRPWYVQVIPAQRLQLSVYLPKNIIPSTGALFHSVMRHQQTGVISSYFTRLYTPVRVKSSRFLGCSLNPTATELVFLLLYPDIPPKGYHLSVVVFDLLTMTVKDVRVDIPLTEDQYVEALETDTVSFAVSGVSGTLGSDYLFLSIGGNLLGISLLTGQEVLRLEDPDTRTKFGGCIMNAQLWRTPSNSRLCIVSSGEGFYILNYAEKHNSITVLDLQQGADDSTRKQMALAFKRWNKCSLPPPSQRIDGGQFYVEGDIHPNVLAYSICLDILDRVVSGRHQDASKENLRISYLIQQKKLKEKRKKEKGKRR